MELATGIEKKTKNNQLKVTDFPQTCFWTTLWLKQWEARAKDSQLLHFVDQFRPSLNSASYKQLFRGDQKMMSGCHSAYLIAEVGFRHSL